MTTTIKELIESEISDFFAGFGCPGGPETPEEIQHQLLTRVIPLLAAIQQESLTPTIQCWSCRDEIEVSAIGDCDGYCPKCDAPIDLDEEPTTYQQPAPVVPDEIYWQDAPVEGSTRAAAYAEGWNACRATMLNGGKS